ncbi:hypothetical protein E2P81_ATG05878 [Venturia nashicola]|nr:hypothetical protein E2P81_ATG05878 [Venturia nashicola]
MRLLETFFLWQHPFSHHRLTQKSGERLASKRAVRGEYKNKVEALAAETDRKRKKKWEEDYGDEELRMIQRRI